MPDTEHRSDQTPAWYRDAVIYQLHIKAFQDADGNGIGDFRGLIQRLDYLQQLGVTAVWLLPFYPSPLKDDGYDIADYYRVNPSYNTLADFKRFLKAAHARGLRVITELVLNHTSDQHPWFQRARRARPGSSHRNYYVWSDSPEKYRDARIIFQDFETSNWSWDPVAKAYYWHRFYAHQPDLNFDHPQVRKEMFKVLDFWFGLGVDGLRLDAVPYLFEREGTNCENLPETHAFLKELRGHIDARFDDRMLLAEANQWPEDAVAYFGDGDECQMAFHFPIMPRMFMALQMEDRFPLTDILEQTPAIPENCQWAIFLRNHDELTLEMVTDEERDYMYRVYARDPRARINLGIRRRLAPLMRNSRRKIELMNILLFSLPGTPILYYGDEIGMGDNYYLGDRDGVRTPMQWSPDRNAGFSRANPQRLYLPVIIEPEYHYEAVNVETQESNPSSLLWWTRRVIAMRRRHRAFGRGSLEMLFPDNPKVLAFIRRHEDETVLVVVNLSRYSQVARIDLSAYAGMVPEEVFSRNRFPTIHQERYVLTLGVHDYYWFLLRPADAAAEAELPALALRAGRSWEQVLQGRAAETLLDAILPAYLQRCRWFRGKARKIRQVKILDHLPVIREARLVLVQVHYTEGSPELYALPMTWLPQVQARTISEEHLQARIAPLRLGDAEGELLDAAYLADFRDALLRLFSGRHRVRGATGELVGIPGRGFRRRTGAEALTSRLLTNEQSNSAIRYGDRFFFKLYRGLEEGVNPDPEITRYLTEQARYPQLPPYAGSIEYRREGQEPVVVGLLQGFVANQGDAWTFTLDVLAHVLERILTHRQDLPGPPSPCPSLLACRSEDLSPHLADLLGTFYQEMAALLGQRTAQMHLALARNARDATWRPEEFSLLYQRSVYQSMRSLCRRTFQTLEESLPGLEPADGETARALLSREGEVLALFDRVRRRKFSGMKIRTHGDFHLGQVLFTGKDFVIIDFEGEPARTLTERRLKRSPLRDVAGMIRSFHYAAQTALRQHLRHRPEDDELLAPWLDAWFDYAAGAFLGGYLEAAGDSGLLPGQAEETGALLEALVLEKAIYELGYELNNRPAWVAVPLRGIVSLLDRAT